MNRGFRRYLSPVARENVYALVVNDIVKVGLP